MRHLQVRTAYVATWHLSDVVLWPKNLRLSGIRESARTMVVLDVDGERDRFNVKNTHTRQNERSPHLRGASARNFEQDAGLTGQG